MISKEQIEKAIAAHGLWKGRLEKAIDSGRSDFNVDVIKADNNCDFGKWLYSLTPEEQKKDNWKKAQKLHAEFHNETSNVLNLALKGLKQDALVAMGVGSKFKKISTELTQTMMSWMKSL